MPELLALHVYPKLTGCTGVEMLLQVIQSHKINGADRQQNMRVLVMTSVMMLMIMKSKCTTTSMTMRLTRPHTAELGIYDYSFCWLS